MNESQSAVGLQAIFTLYLARITYAAAYINLNVCPAKLSRGPGHFPVPTIFPGPLIPDCSPGQSHIPLARALSTGLFPQTAYSATGTCLCSPALIDYPSDYFPRYLAAWSFTHREFMPGNSYPNHFLGQPAIL